MMKRYLFLVIGSLSALLTLAQPGTGYNKNYRLLRSGSTTLDKNFYLVTVINQSPAIAKLLAEEERLAALCFERKKHLTDKTIANTDSLFELFRWNNNDSAQVAAALQALYAANKTTFDQLIDGHLRPSGYYQRFKDLDNAALFQRAWGQYFQGINYIISQYGMGKKMRYPNVDSASYDVHSKYYNNLLHNLFTLLNEKKENLRLFYEPSLHLAMRLMDINDRDEPAQFEPLEAGENKPAFQKVKQVAWDKYQYAAILVPGEGPEIEGVALSPGGKLRCELAAARYKKGLAPFIIVSGGNVHPFQTSYNEAWRMQQCLIKQHGIPETAIIIEPQARHTTTNFRNAARLMIRYGMPTDKIALCVTTVDQADYIENTNFDKRNMRELGYLPYRDKKRLSTHEISFYPVPECLHMDPNDPLDP